MITWQPGNCRWIWAVATMPSMTGMRTSIRMTSGHNVKRFFDGFLAVHGLPDHTDAFLDIQQRCDAFAHQALIVGDQDRHIVVRWR